MMSANSSTFHAPTVVRNARLCSGHVLINYERQIRHLPLLQRSRSLDTAAKEALQIALSYSASSSSSVQSSPSTDLTGNNSTKGTELQLYRTSSTKGHQLTRSLQKGQRSESERHEAAMVVQTVLHGDEWAGVRELNSRAMHQGLKDDCQKIYQEFRDNVLSTVFTEVGHGTARARDGSLLMVQIFRGNEMKKQ